MAYVLKYYKNFKSVKDYGNGETYRLEIYLEGYGGSSSEIEKIDAESIVLSREGELLDNVLGTKLTFGIYNQTEGEYKEFRNASWGDYMVKLIFDPSSANETKFIGYNQSEIYSEPYNQPPYISQLEFTCGLSHLKNVRFENTGAGTLYTGQKTIIEVLRLCLNKLPNPIGLREFVNIYEDSISSGTTFSMLNQIWVDSTVYKEFKDDDDEGNEVGFFCHKVIEEILKPFNAHIYHANGIWYIVRVQEYLDTTMYYRNYNANVGSESTVTISGAGSFSSNKRTVTGANGMSNELVLQAENTDMAIDPPLNRVKVTYNQENLDIAKNSLTKNGCFEWLTFGAYKEPKFWDITDNATPPLNYMHVRNNKWWFSFEPVAQAAATVPNYGVYLEQTKTGIPTATTDSLQFSFDFWFSGYVQLNAGGSLSNHPKYFLEANMSFTWEVELTFGSYYLSGDAINGYSWTTTPSKAKFEHIGLGAFSSGVNMFETVTQTLPTLPENAIRDMSIKIYRCYTNWASYAATNNDYTMSFDSLRQTCFKLKYLPNELAPTDELILYGEIDEDENLEEIETIHGDGGNTVTLNSFRLASGLITDSWDRRGRVDNASVLTVLLRQLRDLRSNYVKVLTGVILSEMEVYNTIEDTTDVTTVYWMRGYDWNVVLGEWDVDLMELRNDTAVSLSVDEVTESGSLLDDTELTSSALDPNNQNSNQSIVTQPTVLILNQNNTNNYA